MLLSVDIADTIAAIATAPGRGGIGIVRLSGPRARAVAEPLLELRTPLAAGRARFAHVLDPQTGEPLDEAVVTFFAAPHSYTGEDVVEIAGHGAPVLLGAMLRACLAGGARLAEPGEFTQRAFLAGRLGLTEAEAVNDLIQASTLGQARVAAAQLGGSVARAVAPIKQALVALVAELEAGVDFAEDDLDLLPEAEIVRWVQAVRAPVEALAGTYRFGRVLREGFTLAIVGRPNAGKSSLFNRLLERDRAIVTAQPGTTRDPISERFSLGGIPVELVDTAGLRDAPAGAAGEAEAQGIARTRTWLAEADVVLHVADATEPWHAEDAATLALLAGRPHLLVRNKADLCAEPDSSLRRQESYATSAKTGAGLEQLRAAIVALLRGDAAGGETARGHQPAATRGARRFKCRAGRGGVRGAQRAAARTAALGPARRARSAGRANRHDHAGRHPEPDLFELLHRQIVLESTAAIPWVRARLNGCTQGYPPLSPLKVLKSSIDWG